MSMLLNAGFPIAGKIYNAAELEKLQRKASNM